MPSPKNDSPMSSEVPEGAIFLPITNQQRLRAVEAALFSLLVPNRSTLDDLSIDEKTILHEKLSVERNVLLGLIAVRS